METEKKKYVVRYIITGFTDIEVEANSEEEAIKKGNEIANGEDFDEDNFYFEHDRTIAVDVK